MKKVDRRIKRTRQSLKDALISLIEEKELSAIDDSKAEAKRPVRSIN